MHAPPEKNDKNGAIWCNLGVPKYVITNLKSTILRIRTKTTKLNCHIFVLDRSRSTFLSTKINTFRIHGSFSPISTTDYGSTFLISQRYVFPQF